MNRETKIVPPTVVDGKKPCRCGSGYYCHRHQRYRVARDVGAAGTVAIRDPHADSGSQPCGGGNRLMRR